MKYLYLCLIGISLQGLFIIAEKNRKYLPAVILKGCASAMFILLGILGSARMPAIIDLYRKNVVTGLILGGIGDVLLNLRFLSEKYGQKIFLVGILVFLSGHVLYLIALLRLSTCSAVSLACGAALAAVLLVWTFRNIEAKKAFKIFGIFYIGAISLMTAVAGGNLITDPCGHNAVFFAGAVMFLISDVVLIFNTFGKKSRFSLRITNLGFYYIGQLLIALSLQLFA